MFIGSAKIHCFGGEENVNPFSYIQCLDGEEKVHPYSKIQQLNGEEMSHPFDKIEGRGLLIIRSASANPNVTNNI